MGRRRERGFQALGAAGLPPLHLGRERERDLVLAQAWRRAAGEALARKARPVSLRRGVLEIEVSDWRWAAALTVHLPALASRLASLAPSLGVKRFQVRGGRDEKGVGADTVTLAPGPKAKHPNGDPPTGAPKPGVRTAKRAKDDPNPR